MLANDFTKITDILPRVLEKIGLQEKIDEKKVLSIWDETMGGEIASVTEAVKFEKGVLHVQVDHGAWMQELQFMEKEIRKQVNERLSRIKVRKIRFAGIQKPKSRGGK